MNTSFSRDGLELSDEIGLYSVVSAAAAAPHRITLCAGVGGDVAERTRALASALMERGVRAGERIALLGRTSLESALLDVAALAVGVVVVPVYPTSSDLQIRHVIADSGAVHFAAESDEDAIRLTSAGASSAWTFAELAQWRFGPSLPDLLRSARVGRRPLIQPGTHRSRRPNRRAPAPPYSEAYFSPDRTNALTMCRWRTT
ncbi:long-chain fatty acid--CoA ligase [Rhodococcus sp. IEGM 248]|uniref:AMP-binding protein n=1 Tax=Rhodococcus opacus TaxID=37919 RepID=UPI0013BFA178|nr:AMP-binding protein [Rhodococcus opacus]MDV7088263.1 AMP-binding protein [Rhodococcus opacus]NDV10234.1 long-chain fatty acid--CoA ligase [Rhodococcus sp. IEGM 248]